MSGDHNQYQASKLKITPSGVTHIYSTGASTAEKREWVGLTDEEIDACDPSDECWNLMDVARAIEAKLKEKNAYGWQSVANPTEYLDELRGGEDT